MKVYVGSVGYSAIEVRHLTSVLALQQFGVQVHIQGKHALWEISRSLIASSFLRDTDTDVLLLVEADVAFEPADAMRLCAQAERYDVVAAACGESERDACWVDDAQPPREDSGDLVPVRWVGSGMVAIHRRVLEAMSRRADLPSVRTSEISLWPFFYPTFIDLQGSRLVANDVQAFCERAREGGFGVYLNLAVHAARVTEGATDPIDVFITNGLAIASSKEATHANGRTIELGAKPPDPRATEGAVTKKERPDRSARHGPTRVGVGPALVQREGEPLLFARRGG